MQRQRMVTRCSAFFAAMKANLIGSASRRTPLLFLGCLVLLPRCGELSEAAPTPRVRRRQTGAAFRPIRLCRPTSRVARGRPPPHSAFSSTNRTACCLNSSVNRRRARRLRVSAIVDIVSAFRKMSTKPDQVQSPAHAAMSFEDKLAAWRVALRNPALTHF